MRLRLPIAAAAAALLALAASGCGSLDLGLQDRLTAPVLPVAPGDINKAWGRFTFDELGNARLNGMTLRLPTARESERFGVTFVDASALPPAWRPAPAAAGGIMVSAIEKASPLAAAGLAPFDVVRRINGDAVDDVDSAVRALREVEPGQNAVVVVASGDTIVARTPVAAHDETHVYVPLVCETRAATNGSSLGLGPWDGLFYYRSTLREHVPDRAPGLYEHFEWGTLFNIVKVDTYDAAPRHAGRKLTCVRLFWVLPLDFEG
jgi:hypothetical protein